MGKKVNKLAIAACKLNDGKFGIGATFQDKGENLKEHGGCAITCFAAGLGMISPDDTRDRFKVYSEINNSSISKKIGTENFLILKGIERDLMQSDHSTPPVSKSEIKRRLFNLADLVNLS